MEVGEARTTYRDGGITTSVAEDKDHCSLSRTTFKNHVLQLSLLWFASLLTAHNGDT